jgi:hypothetical protein
VPWRIFRLPQGAARCGNGTSLSGSGLIGSKSFTNMVSGHPSR